MPATAVPPHSSTARGSKALTVKSIKPVAGTPSTAPSPIDRTTAEAAVRSLIRWAGDAPARVGLIETPARVGRAFAEFLAGYKIDPAGILQRPFKGTEASADMVVMR